MLSVPHDEPLQPVPESDQFSTELGFDPGANASVATIVAELPAGRFVGAVSCSVKLLVMSIVPDACFEGSAALVAVTVTLEAVGRRAGAV